MNKACPIILRHENTEFLAFEHPKAGYEIVKGTIEAGETIEDACVRELREESGIEASGCTFIGQWATGFEDQVWGFCQMRYESELPDAWEHDCEDGGGLRFTFFWQPLELPLDDRWHTLFQGAVEYIRQANREGRLT